jgi:hypothetical protein
VATAISIACFACAALSFGWGFVTEYRQSRAPGPVAIVPTLPFGVAAAVFVEFGVLWLRLGIPFWVHVLVFLGSAVLFGFAILKASTGSYCR